MNKFSFDERLAMSAGVSVSDDISALLLERVPGALAIDKACTRDDRSGTDYWIRHARGTPISVDVKVRGKDPVESYGRDDLALETWSVIGSKIGWTLDETKRTDYVLWWFTPTRRWVLVPFVQLQAAFRKRQDEWMELYRVEKQQTVGAGRSSGWQSECVFVPRREIWAAIYTDFGGQIIAEPANVNTFIEKLAIEPKATSLCDLCSEHKVVTITGTDARGERTICSQCWRKHGFSAVPVAANDNAGAHR